MILAQWMILKVSKACENLVDVTSAIGELQRTEFLKPLFLSALKWAIYPVLSDHMLWLLTPLLFVPSQYCV